MLYVTAMLFQLGVVASILLGIACAVSRILVGSRTRRWIGALEQAKVTPAVSPSRAPTGEEATVEVWDHVVQFYGHDAELVDAVSGYLSAAIDSQEVAIVVATEEHRRAFDVAMAANGVDVAAARTSGSYIVADAAETVSKFVTDGQVRRDLFGSVVGQLMRTASASGRPVRVYGEMVALLWDAGHINAAVDLEGLWNELGSVLPFSLYCAYPTHSVTGAAHRADLEAVCHLHAHVVGSAGTGLSDHLNEQEPIPASPGRGATGRSAVTASRSTCPTA